MFYIFGSIHGLVFMTVMVAMLWVGVGPLAGGIALGVCVAWLALCLCCAGKDEE